MEYYELGSTAAAKLYWSSDSVAREIIPQSNLFSSTSVPTSTADKTPPTTPKNLYSIKTTDTSVALSWVHATDNVALSRYDVYRDGVKVGSTRAVSYIDADLVANSTHSYIVKAVDSSSNPSAPSNPFAVTTLAFYDGTAPSTPGNLNVTGKTDSSVTLAWNDSTDNISVTAYDIYRGDMKVGSADPSSCIYTDLNLNAGSAYSYTVVARDASGNISDASNPVTQMTDTSSPTGNGNGLAANYYDNTDFTSLKATRTDNNVNFIWADGAPINGMGADSYSVRWQGQVLAKYTEQYTFYTYTDDGVRLWVNNRLVIDHWTAHAAAEDSAKVFMNQGQMYNVTMEYYDDTAAAQAKLSWSSSTQGKQVIPSSFLYSSPVSATPPPVAGDWSLNFNDEFNSLNTNTWGNRYWWNGNSGEETLFKPENTTVNNGVLTFTAKKETGVGYNGKTYNYSSSLLTTGGVQGGKAAGFTFTYGYMEARIKIPAGQGLWPSFWTRPANYNDDQAELDVMEIVASRPNIHEMHYHYNGSEAAGNTWDAGKSLGDDYHVYAMDWEKDHISWYVDGVERFRYTNAAKITSVAQYFILNLDMGGPWAGSPDNTTPVPAQMNVDYVRLWQHS